MGRLSIPISTAGVSNTNVTVPVPIAAASIVVNVRIDNPDAIVTIPGLGLKDIPAAFLRQLALAKYIPTGGNLDFLVRLSTGATETITGEVSGRVGVAGPAGPTPAVPRGVILTAGSALLGALNIPQFDIVQGTSFPVSRSGLIVNDALYWDFPLRGYVGGDLALAITWYSTAIVGNVNWEAALAAISIGLDTGSIETKAFAAATAQETSTNANLRAGSRTLITITGAALDSADIDDMTTLRIRRIAASVSEMVGDALFRYAEISWYGG